MVPSLSADISLSPEEIADMVPGSRRVGEYQDTLRRVEGVSGMTRRELGARAQSVGASLGQYAVATPKERRAATSLVGDDYVRRQELLDEYSPEQIRIWTNVAGRTDKIMLEWFEFFESNAPSAAR